MSSLNFIQNITRSIRHKTLLKKVHTPLPIAVAEITKRRHDSALVKDIRAFLNNDIPPHFDTESPIFYFSRYVATPDLETLLFIDRVENYNFPIIIGEDSTDILTSHSTLKRNLLKLPIITGESSDGTGIVEYERIADLNSEQGKVLKEVRLHNGSSLIDFHHQLSSHFLPKRVQIIDESKWVDRHSRGKLVELYENMLALLLVHGIMLECYEPCEVDFLSETVLPAYIKTKERFGIAPFIAPLVEKKSKKIRDFNSYPAAVQKYIRRNLST